MPIFSSDSGAGPRGRRSKKEGTRTCCCPSSASSSPGSAMALPWTNCPISATVSLPISALLAATFRGSLGNRRSTKAAKVHPAAICGRPISARPRRALFFCDLGCRLHPLGLDDRQGVRAGQEADEVPGRGGVFGCRADTRGIGGVILDVGRQRADQGHTGNRQDLADLVDADFSFAIGDVIGDRPAL